MNIMILLYPKINQINAMADWGNLWYALVEKIGGER